ncbi:hypothetical protein [Catenovulum maritimum]|uniref:Yip1 domain-containing protein n=1 Tax=Catenovulum maritimum TaxID=1513271 RepID=A0A0J8JKQ6_9ALTE|nr:hypothetical protein [Catenovulum maritimum]KMT65066.1 hypothetical protein XM47_11400 [Catenovulum maritimum]
MLFLTTLYFRPSLFFKQLEICSRPLYLIIASWAYGIFHTLDRIDRHLLKESLNRPWPGWELFEPVVNMSWLNFWIVLLVIGAPAGVVAYFLGGWWYKIRLKWAGAKQVETHTARYLHIYSQLVMSLPTLLLVLIQSLFYDNYRQAWQTDVIWFALFSAFPFWSCFTSYYAASRICQLKRKAALFWLVYAPSIMYILAYLGYWQLLQHFAETAS